MTRFPAAKNRLTGNLEREIRAQVSGEIARALEARALVPSKTCDPRWCHCHAKHEAWREAAGVARQVGARP